MKNYVKNLYDLSKSFSVPEFIGQRERITCPHCNREMVIPVPTTGIDWEIVAKDYQGYAKKMWEECNLLLSQAEVDTLLQKQLQDILKKCEGLL